jgi:hypothetical protein
MRRVTIIIGWLLLLAMAQVSRNPTIGLLAVVCCAFHVGIVLAHPLGRRRPPLFGLGGGSRFVHGMLGPALRLPAWIVRCRLQRARIDIPVLVHLGDRQRAAEIERHLRTALMRCAETWAPYPLPVDRVSVYAGAPPTGKAQTYDSWLPEGVNGRRPGSLVVLSLGLHDAAGRLLELDTLVGVIAGQVAALVADRYRREHATGEELAMRAATVEVETAQAGDRTVPADLVGRITPADEGLSALMQRLREQARPLEPDGVSVASTHTTRY